MSDPLNPGMPPADADPVAAQPRRRLSGDWWQTSGGKVPVDAPLRQAVGHPDVFRDRFILSLLLGPPRSRSRSRRFPGRRP